MKTTNAFITESFTPTQWEETPDGFLRVKARVLAERIMPYAKRELVGVPETISSDPVMMLVDRSAMSCAESLRTLEGVPVVAPDHTWVTPDNAGIAKGNTAGTPYMEGPYTTIDLLITDPQTIQDIKDRKIGEISAGYHAESIFEDGEFDGQPYQARQVGIRYNHIAVIPYGHGRAGQDVRIMNHKQEVTNTEGGKKMAYRVKLKNTNRFINVEDEETAQAIEAEGAATEEISSRNMEETMSELEAKNGELAAVQSEVEELKGELSVYKEKLDQLLSEEMIEHAAMEMASEAGEAEEVIENAVEDEKEKEEIMNSIHGLFGSRLHAAVLGACGVQIENASPDALRNIFKAQVQIVRSGRFANKKVVAGSKMFEPTQKHTNSKPAERSVLNRLGFKTA